VVISRNEGVTRVPISQELAFFQRNQILLMYQSEEMRIYESGNKIRMFDLCDIKLNLLSKRSLYA
jgi:hypothetical protein